MPDRLPDQEKTSKKPPKGGFLIERIQFVSATQPVGVEGKLL